MSSREMPWRPSALNWRRIWGILRAILGLLLERVVARFPILTGGRFSSKARIVKAKNYWDLRLTSCHSSHTLYLHFHDGSNHHELEILIDATEVTELKRQCERAERKAAVLKDDL